MTKEERNIKLKHLITCMKCEVSGKMCDDNCPTQYEAGNMGEIIENLEAISKMLEQEPCKDAISREWLKTAIHNFYYGLKHTPTEEDIQAYIDAAPPTTPQPCEDCINREQAKVAIRDRFKDLPSRVEINTILNELPSVTPQPKTGHWQKISADKYSEHAAYYFRCSECGKDIIGEHNYCPNCGSRMKGVSRWKKT